jgi:TolB-like protein
MLAATTGWPDAAPDPAVVAHAAPAPEPPAPSLTPPVPAAERVARAAAPHGVRIGVLPLSLIGTSPQDGHLSTGLADDITAGLARFRWMVLVSSGALARLAQRTRDEGELRRAFGLDLVLDGTVQRAGGRLRVSLRLLDLRIGNKVVWSDRFDHDAGDVLNLQDRIAAEAVARIEPEVVMIESQRAASRPSDDCSAYELMMRALPLISRFERPVFMRAGKLLARAIELEPEYAAAHAWYAYWHIFLVGQDWTEDAAAGMVEAGRLAERAITLDPQDGKALTIAGHVRAFLHHRLREALTLHERALTLNPNLAMAWNLSGLACAYLGDHAEAERRIDRYKELSPLDPQAFFFDTARVIVALLRQHHEQAAATGREVTELNPAFLGSLKPYLSALGHLGHQPEAELVLSRVLTLEPGFTVGRFMATTPFQREEDRQHFAEGLRRAGVAA